MRLVPKPSILFINRNYPPSRSGVSHILQDLAQAFEKDGWDVKILTTGLQTIIQQQGSIQIIRAKSTGRKTLWGQFQSLLSMFSMARKIQRTDLIVTMTDPPFLILIGRYLSQKNKSSHIHWCQDLYPDMFPVIGQNLPNFIMTRLTTLSRQAMKSCDRVVVVGRCMAKYLVNSGLDQSKLSFIPNWLTSQINVTSNTIKTFNTNIAKEKPKKPLVTDPNPKFRVLYSNNLSRLTPIAVILDAAELLQQENPEIEFIFMGEGPAYEKIAQERSKRGLENIKLTPPQPDSRHQEMMQSGDIHLLSLKTEAAGIVVPMHIYDAFAAERPCILIGPEETEIAKIINDYKAGKVISQPNAKELASLIKTYRLEEHQWIEAHLGAARAAKDFAPETSLSVWLVKARDVIGYKAA